MRWSVDSLSRFRFILTITVMMLLMLSLMQWFKRFYTASEAVESALLGRHFSEQLSLIHGQWLSAHYPAKIWLSAIPGGYFVMASSGWPVDWVRSGEVSAPDHACERLWLAMMGHHTGASEIKFSEDGCQFLFENQRLDYIFANGNVMVH